MTNTDRYKKLQQKIAHFAAERQWEPFHTPKNLCMALSVECAELLEIFQWLTPEQSRDLDSASRAHVKEEIGDVMIYLSMVGAAFDIDVLEAASDKLSLNEQKYPVPKEIR
jgi:NTP pyrophosphatase (non-canonical NTP hydrolase)